MKKTLIILAAVFFLALLGCGGIVKYAPREIDSHKKMFIPPANDLSAIYIFRDGYLGSNVNTEVFVNGKILGKNLGKTYLYIEVAEGQQTITSHFVGYTQLQIETKKGQIYFINEILDTGLLSTKLMLKQVENEMGEKGVLSCRLAESAF